MGQKPEEQLKENFTKQDLKIDGFNSIHYIGERNDGRDTDFNRIRKAVFEELENISVRSPRQPKIILDMLDVSIFFLYFYVCVCVCVLSVLCVLSLSRSLSFLSFCVFSLN